MSNRSTLNPYVYKDNAKMFDAWTSKLNDTFKEAETHLNNRDWVLFNTIDQTDLDNWQIQLACSFASVYDNSVVFIYFAQENKMNRFCEFYHIESLNFKNGSKIILSDGKKLLGINKGEIAPNGFHIHNENMLFIVNKAHWFSKATQCMTAIKNTATERNNLILAIDNISQEEQKEYSSRFKIVSTNEQ